MFFGHLLKSHCAFAGGYVIVDEKLPRFVVPDLTDFKVMGSPPHPQLTDLICMLWLDMKCQIVLFNPFII
jgi:hypothetical protein